MLSVVEINSLIDGMGVEYEWDSQGVDYLKEIVQRTEKVFNDAYLPDFEEVELEYLDDTCLDNYIHFALVNYAWTFLDFVEAELYDNGPEECFEALERDRNSLVVAGDGVGTYIELESGADIYVDSDIQEYIRLIS